MLGRILGHYAILSKLGEGCMGEVYRATDTKLGRQVALKVLPADTAGDPERFARFQREARAVAALNHPKVSIGATVCHLVNGEVDAALDSYEQAIAERRPNAPQIAFAPG